MNLVSIPTAVYNYWFEWQLDLFWHMHKEVYGRDAYKKAHAIIIKRNKSNEEKAEKFEWKNDIPHTMCEAHFDYMPDLSNPNYIPINIQIGLKQIIDKFNDETVLEILDCDLFHFKKHPDFNVENDEIIVCDVYENWHLFSRTKNKSVIEKYFKNGGEYYNGGFVPIIAKKSVINKILDDWIWIHKDLVDNYSEQSHHNIRWWSGMYSLQAACERNRIKMVSSNFCYIPNINLIQQDHYIAHYSCDPRFNKKTYPQVNYSSFLDNDFYNSIIRWKEKSRASSGIFKMFL